jgi:hypothetical protein
VDTDIEVNIQTLPNPNILPVGPVCVGESVQLIANGSPDLVWSPNPLLTDLALAVQDVTPPAGTTTFNVTDVNACGEGSASLDVVVQVVNAEVVPEAIAICLGDDVDLVAAGAPNAVWFPPAGLDNPNSTTVTASPTADITYNVVLTDDLGCSDQTSVDVSVVPGPPGGMTYPTEEVCVGFGVQLPGSDGDQWQWGPAEFVNDPNVQFPFAFPDATTTFSVDIANICGVGTDEVTVVVRVPEAIALRTVGCAVGTFLRCQQKAMTPIRPFSGLRQNWSCRPQVPPRGSSQLHPNLHRCLSRTAKGAQTAMK